VLDVESGDATAAQAVTWCTETMKDVSNSLLTVYCDAANWQAVRAAFSAAGVSEPNWWIAAYDNSPTIPAGAIAHQYASNDAYDTSVVADYWPGVDPVPVPPEDDMPLTAADLSAIGETVESKIQAYRPTAVADTLYWLAAAVTGQPPKGGVAPVDQASIATLHAALVASPAAGLATAEKQIAALSAQVTALSAALAAVAKGELTAAEVQAAVAAALTAAGHPPVVA
jgi:hypothetical protein